VLTPDFWSVVANDQYRVPKMATLGSTVLRFEQLPSTNDLAGEMAASGAEEGIAIIARGQTAGRGRQGRAWTSPPGEGLYLSLILRPRIKADSAAVITLGAAVAVAETLIRDVQLQVDIKWPNDVLASGRKVCGILVETAIEKDHLLYAVMGIGVNVAQRDFPDEIRDSATSILIESGKLMGADDLLAPLLGRVEHWYRMALSSSDAVIARWSELSSYARDCSVTVETPDGPVDGVTRGLTASGALIVETASRRHEIISGEVKLRKVASSS
jgi:BirA family biotin operon repressor/biotin-[acetyl-CoA-carboxylase] ligase